MGWLAPLDIGLIMGLISAWAVLSVALPFRLLNFPDLTVEGTVPLSAAVCAAMLKGGAPLPLAAALAMLMSALAGALTAYLHLRLRLNKFLAGIIVVAITYSLSLRIMGTSNISLLQEPSVFDPLAALDQVLGGKLHVGQLALLTFLLAAGTSILIYSLSSRVGVRLRVAGSNPVYASSIGISVPRHIITGLALTNCLAAVSGILLAMHQGFADVSMGHGVLILALASLTVGERIIPADKLHFVVFVITAAIAGSTIYQLLTAYAVSLGIAPTDLRMATAILVLAVAAARRTRGSESLSEAM